MLAVFVTSLILGGGLLVLSLVTGGGDDHGAGDGDGDFDSHDHHGHEGLGLGQALPITSLSFWTFFLAFFGLTGALLTVLGLVPSAIITTALSAALGYGLGLTATRVIRKLRTQQIDSSVSPKDLFGALGTVLLPVVRGQPGKVRLQLKGRLADFIAVTDESAPLQAKARVVVQEVLSDGTLKVVALGPEPLELGLPDAPQLQPKKERVQ